MFPSEFWYLFVLLVRRRIYEVYEGASEDYDKCIRNLEATCAFRKKNIYSNYNPNLTLSCMHTLTTEGCP